MKLALNNVETLDFPFFLMPRSPVSFLFLASCLHPDQIGLGTGIISAVIWRSCVLMIG